MLINGEIFGRGALYAIYLLMTFSQLTQDLILQGWRAYYIEKGDMFTEYHRLHKIATFYNIELLVYEGKKVIFAKTTFPPIETKKDD